VQQVRHIPAGAGEKDMVAELQVIRQSDQVVAQPAVTNDDGLGGDAGVVH
jgi:hypothetical protein